MNTELTDNSIQLKKDLELFLYQLRISAQVHVVEMVRDSCISENEGFLYE